LQREDKWGYPNLIGKGGASAQWLSRRIGGGLFIRVLLKKKRATLDSTLHSWVQLGERRGTSIEREGHISEEMDERRKESKRKKKKPLTLEIC